jgi:UDP-GlcNAc3NAcA epimerase
MSDVFVNGFDLEIDINLRVKNNSTVDFISNAMSEIGKTIETIEPDVVMVVGDTNSTLAAALVANKMGIPVVHIESGMRCGDKSRPEEINRILVDEISSMHFVSTADAAENVSNPVYVGDMEYLLLSQLERDGKIPEPTTGNYLVLTIHRQENTTKDQLMKIMDLVKSTGIHTVFPAHHRTVKAIESYKVIIPSNIEIIDPVGYLEMTKLLAGCRSIITDSGGIQKTAPFFGKKCLVPLLVTEWNDVVQEGYAKLGYDINWLIDGHKDRDASFYLCPESMIIMHNCLSDRIFYAIS